jgi:hypothetical protein
LPGKSLPDFSGRNRRWLSPGAYLTQIPYLVSPNDGKHLQQAIANPSDMHPPAQHLPRLLLHIPAHHEHPFCFIVNTCSGPS